MGSRIAESKVVQFPPTAAANSFQGVSAWSFLSSAEAGGRPLTRAAQSSKTLRAGTASGAGRAGAAALAEGGGEASPVLSALQAEAVKAKMIRKMASVLFIIESSSACASRNRGVLCRFSP